MSFRSRAWMVAGAVGVVEALKDQGFARWNTTIRTIQHHAKSNLRSIAQAKILTSPAAMASSKDMEEKAKQSEESLRKFLAHKMTSLNRVWMATGVAVANGHTDQGYKLKSLLLNSFPHGKKAFTSDLRPLSGLLISDVVSVGERKTTQSDESLRQVMYFNCWGQS
ncbi:unnamed protein product [Lactuca saligna]|uniref:Uncharacterized protein n=1 Tax=Lactuca saligna TaxID=75948 RepID=A0AA35YKE8_LACSI|nr:unnamed protein product [Lactuca saligna]